MTGFEPANAGITIQCRNRLATLAYVYEIVLHMLSTNQCFLLLLIRDNRIRTCGILLPRQARYQTALYPDNIIKIITKFYFSKQFFTNYIMFALTNILCTTLETCAPSFNRFFIASELKCISF
jgi:hypothetical protein